MKSENTEKIYIPIVKRSSKQNVDPISKERIDSICEEIKNRIIARKNKKLRTIPTTRLYRFIDKDISREPMIRKGTNKNNNQQETEIQDNIEINMSQQIAKSIIPPLASLSIDDWKEWSSRMSNMAKNTSANSEKIAYEGRNNPIEIVKKICSNWELRESTIEKLIKTLERQEEEISKSIQESFMIFSKKIAYLKENHDVKQKNLSDFESEKEEWFQVKKSKKENKKLIQQQRDKEEVLFKMRSEIKEIKKEIDEKKKLFFNEVQIFYETHKDLIKKIDILISYADADKKAWIATVSQLKKWLVAEIDWKEATNFSGVAWSAKSRANDKDIIPEVVKAAELWRKAYENKEKAAESNKRDPVLYTCLKADSLWAQAKQKTYLLREARNKVNIGSLTWEDVIEKEKAAEIAWDEASKAKKETYEIISEDNPLKARLKIEILWAKAVQMDRITRNVEIKALYLNSSAKQGKQSLLKALEEEVAKSEQAWDEFIDTYNRTRNDLCESDRIEWDDNLRKAKYWKKVYEIQPLWIQVEKIKISYKKLNSIEEQNEEQNKESTQEEYVYYKNKLKEAWDKLVNAYRNYNTVNFSETEQIEWNKSLKKAELLRLQESQEIDTFNQFKKHLKLTNKKDRDFSILENASDIKEVPLKEDGSTFIENESDIEQATDLVRIKSLTNMTISSTVSDQDFLNNLENNKHLFGTYCEDHEPNRNTPNIYRSSLKQNWFALDKEAEEIVRDLCNVQNEAEKNEIDAEKEENPERAFQLREHALQLWGKVLCKAKEVKNIYSQAIAICEEELKNSASDQKYWSENLEVTKNNYCLWNATILKYQGKELGIKMAIEHVKAKEATPQEAIQFWNELIDKANELKKIIAEFSATCKHGFDNAPIYLKNLWANQDADVEDDEKTLNISAHWYEAKKLASIAKVTIIEAGKLKPIFNSQDDNDIVQYNHDQNNVSNSLSNKKTSNNSENNQENYSVKSFNASNSENEVQKKFEEHIFDEAIEATKKVSKAYKTLIGILNAQQSAFNIIGNDWIEEVKDRKLHWEAKTLEEEARKARYIALVAKFKVQNKSLDRQGQKKAVNKIKKATEKLNKALNAFEEGNKQVPQRLRIWWLKKIDEMKQKINLWNDESIEEEVDKLFNLQKIAQIREDDAISEYRKALSHIFNDHQLSEITDFSQKLSLSRNLKSTSCSLYSLEDETELPQYQNSSLILIGVFEKALLVQNEWRNIHKYCEIYKKTNPLFKKILEIAEIKINAWEKALEQVHSFGKEIEEGEIEEGSFIQDKIKSFDRKDDLYKFPFSSIYSVPSKNVKILNTVFKYPLIRVVEEEVNENGKKNRVFMIANQLELTNEKGENSGLERFCHNENAQSNGKIISISRNSCLFQFNDELINSEKFPSEKIKNLLKEYNLKYAYNYLFLNYEMQRNQTPLKNLESKKESFNKKASQHSNSFFSKFSREEMPKILSERKNLLAIEAPPQKKIAGTNEKDSYLSNNQTNDNSSKISSITASPMNSSHSSIGVSPVAYNEVNINKKPNAFISINSNDENRQSALLDASSKEQNIAWNINSVCAPAAWTILSKLEQLADNKIAIAFIDTGIDFKHNKLSNHMWSEHIEDNKKTTKTINGCNYSLGYNVLSYDVDDTNGHGTACVGVASSILGHDQPGKSTFSKDVSFMACKASDNELLDLNSFKNCFRWACEHGARIINISNGFYTTNNSLLDDDKELDNMLADAHEKGIVIVTSAGNDGKITDPLQHYPSDFEKRYENIIPVSGTTKEKKLWENSNYRISKKIFLAAPAEEIAILQPKKQQAMTREACSENSSKFLFPNLILEQPYYTSGTSLAAPHVAGGFGIMLQRIIKEQQASEFQNVIQIFHETALDISDGKAKLINIGASLNQLLKK